MEEFLLDALEHTLSALDPFTGKNKFLEGALTKGGVEGWLQVELAATLNNSDVQHVLREHCVFKNPRKAVDFLFSKDDESILLELKVETLFSTARMWPDADDHTLWLSVFKDYVKLQMEVDVDYQSFPAFASAVCWSEAAIESINTFIYTNNLAGQSRVIKAPNGEDIVDLHVYVIKVARDGAA